MKKCEGVFTGVVLRRYRNALLLSLHCVIGLQLIFSTGNVPNFLDIHKVCLQKTAFF